MAYTSYTGLETPNDVIAKMYDYVVSQGYTIVVQLKDDVNIYDMSSVDGKKFVFMDRTNTYFIHIRSFNEICPFGITDDATMDVTTPDVDYKYQGIAMIVSEGYSSTQRWYNQYRIPIKKGSTDVQFVCIPVVNRGANNPDGSTNINANSNKYTLYCNNVTSPADTLLFSVVAENVGGTQYLGHDLRAVHLVVGNTEKYDNWTGGIYFSGSSTPNLIKSAYDLFANSTSGDDPFYEVLDDGILPILSSGSESNTYLRINIDSAPTEARGYIYWASSGADNPTGKRLSLPIRVSQGGNGEIPSYMYLQSTDNLDWGRNINTLNCISINMPIYMAVCVDPDALENYAAVGQVSGLYYVCNLNMQTTYCYEMSYPKSNETCQIFSFSMRRGKYGFDGISVLQNT